MTTKVTIENDKTSNGDVIVAGYATCEGKMSATLAPGERREIWITDAAALVVTERWPSQGQAKPQEQVAPQAA